MPELYKDVGKGYIELQEGRHESGINEGMQDGGYPLHIRGRRCCRYFLYLFKAEGDAG